jgi:Ca2+-binding RTX toxin-like protein
MATVTLTDRNDHYTTTSNDSLVLAKGGNDVIVVQAAYYDQENEIVQIAVYGGPGNDKIIGKPVADHEAFYGGAGNDHIEVWGSVTYSGSALGAGGNDTLVCKGGDEGCSLLGGAGDDTLISEGTVTGAYMTGGPGRDTLAGGAPRDVFVFRDGDTVAGPNRDVIKNFRHGSDVIDLSAVDANVKAPGDQAFTFVAVAKHPGIGEVSYYVSGQNVIVVGNNGAKTFEIELQAFDPPLAATDFHL